MIDTYCPVTDIEIIKNDKDTVLDKTKFKYIDLAGVNMRLLIKVGKYSQSLPITNYQSNGDTPCLGPKDVVSIPITKYEDVF